MFNEIINAVKGFPSNLGRKAAYNLLCALFIAGSFFPLMFVLLGEMIFGWIPCKLCLLQRIPLYLLFPLGIAGVVIKSRILGLCGMIAFLCAGGLAAYHSAVEMGWVKNVIVCKRPQSTKPKTPAQLIELLEYNDKTNCEFPSVRLYGISLAQLNVLYSLFCALLSLLLTLRAFRESADTRDDMRRST